MSMAHRMSDAVKGAAVENEVMQPKREDKMEQKYNQQLSQSSSRPPYFLTLMKLASVVGGEGRFL